MFKNPLDLTGRTILVTGASSGIGRETAILLSELGAKVALGGRKAGRLNETLAQLKGDGHSAEPFDLDDAAGISQWLQGIVNKTGPLYGLVHCAGIHRAAPLRVVSVAGVEEVFHTNVTTAIMLVSAFRKKSYCVPGGGIVLVSSVAGMLGQPAIGAYSASKAALIGFTKSAAMELLPDKLRVNCVAPGFVLTEMTADFREKLTDEQFRAIEQMHPLGLGTPHDIASSIAFLLGDAARWITGTALIVDGGYSAR